jgi:hypothetical protein
LGEGGAIVDRDRATVEIGSTGTQIVAGNIYEEYNPDLIGQKKWDAFTKMRADGQVAALRRVYEQPIMVTDWTVQPAADILDADGKPASSDRAIEIARVVDEMLTTMPDDDWMQTIRQAASAIFTGVMLFEKVYAVRPDGMIAPTKLAARLPQSILRWVTDDHGNFEGIIQEPPFSGLDKVDSAFVRDGGIWIPGDKLIRLTHEQDGSDFEGRGLARDIYKHWFYIDNLEKIFSMAVERAGMGVPVITLPQNFTAGDRAKAIEVVRRLRANQEGGVVLPPGYTFEFTELREPVQIRTMIVHHVAMMARAGLAGFLTLGSNSTGSFALSKDQTDFFLMALESKLEWIRATFQRCLIREITWLNFGADAPMPELKYQLARQNITDRIETMASAVSAQLLMPDDLIENILREALDLPPKDADVMRVDDQGIEEREMIEPPSGGRQKMGFLDVATPHDPSLNGTGLSRAPNARERGFKLAEVSNQWDAFEAELAAAARPILDDAVADMLVQIRRNIERAAKNAGQISNLFDVDVKQGFSAATKRAFKSVGDDAMDWARLAAAERASISSQEVAPRTRRYQTAAWSENVTKMLANLGERMTIHMQHDRELMDEIQKGAVGESTITRVQQTAEQQYIGFEGKPGFRQTQVRAWSQITVGDAIRTGWDATVKDNPEVQAVQRSEILDKNTCDNCRKLDGLVFSQADWPSVSPPDKCFGGSRCRGIGIPILLDETPAPTLTSVDAVPSLQQTRLAEG